MDFQKEMADVSKTFDFFLRLSEFMKFQLDEILPHYITKTKLNIPDRIRDESENLLFSITNFIKFVKTCKVEKVEHKKPNEPEYWPDMMFEMYKSIDDQGNVTKRGFYCGICNFVTFDTDVWNGHYKDDPIHLENDLRIKSGSNVRVDGTYCKYCLGVFYSEVPHLEIIMNSKHHKYIDDLIIRKRNAIENSKNDQPKEEKPLRSSSVASINSAVSMTSSVSSKKDKKHKPIVINNSKNIKEPKKENPFRSSSVASINSADSMSSVSSKQDKKQQKPITPKSNSVSSAVSISSESFPREKPNKKSKKKTEKTSSHFNSNDPNETKDCTNEIPDVKKPSESDLITFSEAQNSSDPVEANLNRLLQYKREHFDSFAGLCIECGTLVDGEFGWSSHIESHGDSNETQRCHICNTGFYGNINLIKHTYLVHKIHTHVIHALK